MFSFCKIFHLLEFTRRFESILVVDYFQVKYSFQEESYNYVLVPTTFDFRFVSVFIFSGLGRVLLYFMSEIYLHFYVVIMRSYITQLRYEHQTTCSNSGRQ